VVYNAAVLASVPVSTAGGVVLFHRLAWCGVGAGVPVLEAGGVVLFGWHGDVVPRGICGVGGGAGCRVVVVALLCCCTGPVSVGRHDMADCGQSVWVVVVSGEVVGGVEGTPHGSPPLGSPLSLSAPPVRILHASHPLNKGEEAVLTAVCVGVLFGAFRAC
jgi:hypothetical protein